MAWTDEMVVDQTYRTWLIDETDHGQISCMTFDAQRDGVCRSVVSNGMNELDDMSCPRLRTSLALFELDRCW